MYQEELESYLHMEAMAAAAMAEAEHEAQRQQDTIMTAEQGAEYLLGVYTYGFAVNLVKKRLNTDLLPGQYVDEDPEKYKYYAYWEDVLEHLNNKACKK